VDEDINIVLFESRLVYGGSVSSQWKSKVSMSCKVTVVMSLLGLMMAMLFCFAAPAQTFIAYCKNIERFIAAIPHLFGLYKRRIRFLNFLKISNSVHQLYTFFDSARLLFTSCCWRQMRKT
jgi:hypothetical protein